MYTLTLTEKEMKFVMEAVEAKLDMENDCALEDLATVDLYPKGDECTKITKDNASQVREELNAILNAAMFRQAIATKFNIKLNESGGVV